MNRTFQGLALLKGIQEVWELLGAPLLNFANDSAGVARLQVGPGRRAAESCPAEDLSKGQGLLGKGVELGSGIHGELRPQGWEEG